MNIRAARSTASDPCQERPGDTPATPRGPLPSRAPRPLPDPMTRLAHELRNPLAALRTASDLLNVHPSRDRTVLLVRRVFRDQLTRLIRVTDELLERAQRTQAVVDPKRLGVQVRPRPARELVSRSPGDPTLPSDPSADRDVEARASPDKPLRILVVDDNRDAVEMLTMLLETLGHAVQSAFDGRRAVAVAAESTPDLILLDIGLPGLDGYEVCRRIRARSEAPRPTIVAVTGWGQDQDKEQARAAGFDHHVTKPLDVAVLRRLIQAHEHSG